MQPTPQQAYPMVFRSGGQFPRLTGAYEQRHTAPWLSQAACKLTGQLGRSRQVQADRGLF